VRFAWLIILVACHEPSEIRDAEPTPPVCDDVQHTATFVDSMVFGPASGTATSLTVPITPTLGGELLVIAVASPTGDYGVVTMVGADGPFQVVTGARTCGKTAVIESLGNVPPGVSSFTIETFYTQPSPVFAVFVMRFAGLAPDTGASVSHNIAGTDDAVPACPGTVVVSTATSCGDVSLSAESPFIALDPIDGMAAAYHIPSSPDEYRADWVATETMSSAIVQFD
jgi:hypothetical protein